ncbi:MAG: type VI secretion system ImpA family N-terminal domain-containing protein [Polyangiaceae bacterium]
MHLTIALLNRNGLEGVCEGLTLVSSLLSTFWPTVHPQLDPEDNDDPTMRITALSALTAPTVLASLRTTAVVRAQALGIAALRDLSSVQGEAALDAATLEGIFQSVDLAALEGAIGFLSQCSAQLARIDQTFEERTGSRGPESDAAFAHISRRAAVRHAALGQS